MRVWGIGGIDYEKEEEHENETQENDNESDADTETESDDADDNQPVRLPNQRTVTIVCVRRPNKILNQLKEEMRFFQTEEPGIYHCQERLSQWIIHPSELTLTPQNYPLLPLARGQKLEQFISLCLKEELTDYLQLIGDIGIITDPNVIWRKILELKLMKPKIRQDTWPYIDRFFREMPEEMWKIPTFQEALAKSQINGEQRNAQKTLIRQLRRKFTPLPDSVVQKIESTTDMEQLDNWLDQIWVAESLADMGLIGTKKPKM